MAASKTLVVAGAGVVGLAVARAAACRGMEVLMLEKNALVGQETSARNSEVVHGTWCGVRNLNFNLIISNGLLMCLMLQRVSTTPRTLGRPSSALKADGSSTPSARSSVCRSLNVVN